MMAAVVAAAVVVVGAVVAVEVSCKKVGSSLAEDAADAVATDGLDDAAPTPIEGTMGGNDSNIMIMMMRVVPLYYSSSTLTTRIIIISLSRFMFMVICYGRAVSFFMLIDRANSTFG